jgi:hypothetical protein
MAVNTFLNCPADCSTPLLIGAFDVTQDCTTYDQEYSQVCDLVIKPSTAATVPLTWATAAPWNASIVANSIDNAELLGAKSKWLVGDGGVAVPEKTSQEYPKRKTGAGKRTYTLVFNIRNLSQTQYNSLRKLQCGQTDFKFWYANVGNHIFGGAAGINPKSLDVDFPLGEGRDDLELAIITITWEADGDPDRNNSPF